MSLRRVVALNTFWQLLAKAIGVGFGLITVALLTDYLGLEGYGDYMFITSAVVIFGGLADWGTVTIGVREAAQETKDRSLLLGNLIILRFLLALFSVLFFIAFAFLFPFKTESLNLVRLGLLISSLFLLTNNLKSSFGIAFQSSLKMQKQALIQTVTTFLVFVFTLIFIHLEFSFLWLIFTLVLASVSTVFLAAFIFFKQEKIILRLDKKIIKKLLIESLPMGLILLFFTLDRQVDTILLGAIKGSGAVGIYALSGRINGVVLLGAAFLMNTLLPILSRVKDEREKVQKIFGHVFWLMFSMGLLAGVLVFVFSPLMIKILTRSNFSEFSSSVLVLRIFSLSLFFAYFNHLTGYTLVAFGKQRAYLLVAGLALVFNVVANLWAINSYSFLGAAWVTVITEAIVFVLTFLLLKQQLNLYPKSKPKELVSFLKNQFSSLREWNKKLYLQAENSELTARKRRAKKQTSSEVSD